MLYLVVLVGLGLCVFGLVVADLIDVLGKSKKQKDSRPERINLDTSIKTHYIHAMKAKIKELIERYKSELPQTECFREGALRALEELADALDKE